jgi:hypothetical protein
MNKLSKLALLLIGLYGTTAFAQMQSAADPNAEPSKTESESESESEQEHPTADETAEEFEKRLDALLAEATAEDAYGRPVHCLYRRKYSDIDIISKDLILFSNRKNYWVNTLKRSCTGLRRDMIIHTVMKGISSLCENDMVFANRSFDLRQGITSSGRPVIVRANCLLGEFKPIDEVYAQSLKAMSR